MIHFKSSFNALEGANKSLLHIYAPRENNHLNVINPSTATDEGRSMK